MTDFEVVYISFDITMLYLIFFFNKSKNMK